METSRTLLGIWAHPDDEAYLSAGLMARTAGAGGRVVCVHATLGERGTDDPVRWPPDRLGPHRRVELRTCLARLGVHESHLLGYPDGGCDEIDPFEAIERIVAVIDEVRPDVLVTFGPDGITGHPDHITVSRWATAAWCREPSGTLLYATSTESFMRRFHDVHRRLGLLAADAPRVGDDEVAERVELTPEELDLKRRALAAHASQTVSLAAAMGEQTYRRWYDIETFRAPTRHELEMCAAVGTS